MSIVCDCGKYDAYTNLGLGTGVDWWVHSACGRPTEAWLRAQGDEMLNYFRGGPLDGQAHETSTMLNSSHGGPQWTRQLAEYRWTSEVIVSERTGKSARVWIHASSPESSEAEPVNAHVGDTDVKNEEKEPIMATKKDVPLEERRKEMKVSRAKVAEQAGLTPAVVYRIEKGGGKTTDEEIESVSAALDALDPS